MPGVCGTHCPKSTHACSPPHSGCPGSCKYLPLGRPYGISGLSSSQISLLCGTLDWGEGKLISDEKELWADHHPREADRGREREVESQQEPKAGLGSEEAEISDSGLDH